MTAPQPAPDHSPKSIQAEHEHVAPVRMAEEDVDNYVDSADADIVTCRERGRHDYPTIRETGMRFVGVNQHGLHVRRVRCKTCKLVDSVEEWDLVHKRGVVQRATRVGAYVDYSVRGPNGEHYLGPAGRGRMTPKAVRSSLATAALKGQSFKEIRKAAMKGGEPAS
jgi:hypothetical protein